MLPVDTYLYSAAESRAVDADAMAQLNVPGYTLMQRAAQAALALVMHQYPGVGAISVVCGKGNNAGDAYLVASGAHQLGIKVQLLAAAPPSSLDGDAATAYAEATAHGLSVEDHFQSFSGGVIVDGLLGTGLRGEPKSDYAQWIERINAAGKPIVSLDVPSGIETDTGRAPGAVVNAAHTLSFITPKIGLHTGAGLAAAGQRHLDDLGVPQQCFPASAVTSLQWRREMLPELKVNTYKHRQGHIVIAGGDDNMPGAVIMAAEAALRAGAGMVTVLTRPDHTTALVSRTPEVMVLGYVEADENDRVNQLLDNASVVVLGPGLGRSQWSESLYNRVVAAARPVLLDADGLYWLANQGSWTGGALTITPHVAEAARLLKVGSDEVQADRLTAARQLAQKYACQGVLKGAGSVVFAQHMQELAICSHGNPGMASAGMGDVLSGVLGGMLGYTEGPFTPNRALHAGVALHSAAADHAALERGQRSLQATDVIAALPALL
ncbi:MAG: NAD(P)H-hydrate dehydratase [Pseudomonadaceae bacterium]|nr:NAD(P)H-hydrate dehydratase [Pseudomonadaceae bacterium]